MSFYGSPRHIELAGYFGVVTSLQQQFNDLLFAWTEPNSLLFHPILPFFDLPHLVGARLFFPISIASTLPF